jgi:hypothetical protein
MPLSGAGVLPGTVVTGFVGASNGGAGTYTVGVLQTVPLFSTTTAAGTSFSGAISGATLTVTAALGGPPLAVGSPVTGPGVLEGTVITGVGADTSGGAGTYMVGVPQFAASTAIVGAPPSRTPSPSRPAGGPLPGAGAGAAAAAKDKETATIAGSVAGVVGLLAALALLVYFGHVLPRRKAAAARAVSTSTPLRGGSEGAAAEEGFAGGNPLRGGAPLGARLGRGGAPRGSSAPSSSLVPRAAPSTTFNPASGRGVSPPGAVDGVEWHFDNPMRESRRGHTGQRPRQHAPANFFPHANDTAARPALTVRGPVASRLVS